MSHQNMNRDLYSAYNSIPNSEKTNNANPYVVGCCTCFGVIFAVGLLLSLPIAELVISNKYSNQIVCNSFISPYTWLVTKASFCLIAIFCLIFLKLLGESFIVFFRIMYILFNLFAFAWLIVGAVMFWHDCPNLEPKPVNTLMYCSLIIGFVSTFISLCFFG